MAKAKVEDIRNIALCGHGAAGKTTLADSLLLHTGAVEGRPSVDDGSSICDFDDLEKHHKHSIESSVIHFDHGGRFFQLVDTPGYPDFIGQTIGALRGVETACIVINAHSGIEVNTRRVFAEAGKAGLGRIIIISKMDTDNIDFPALIERITDTFGNACVPINLPVGHGEDFKGVVSTLELPQETTGVLLDPTEISETLMESIIEVDEQVTERYFEGITPTSEELKGLLGKAIAQDALIPIVCVSGKTGVGLSELLEVLSNCALPANALSRTVTKDGEESQLAYEADGPLVAQVFKTRIDPFIQKLSVVRVFSGKLHKDDMVHVSGSRKSVKMGQLFQLQGGQTEHVDEAGPGAIVAIAKVEDLHINSCLGDYELPQIKFPLPMVGLAIEPKTHGDDAKLSGALKKIVEEDPTFRIDRNMQTNEMVITGMSELHLAMVREKLKGRDHVEVEVHAPKIPYRETIQANAEGKYRHKKQSGGRGQFGEVHVRMFPLPEGVDLEKYAVKKRFAHMRDYHYDPESNFLWVDSIVGGTIPNNFLPAVEKGFKERLVQGVIAGYQVQNVCVEVHFGKHHPVDSSEAAFKTAGSMVFRDVFKQASPSLLEPLVTVHVTVPSDRVGDVNSDMSTRRGRVHGMEPAGGDMQTITAEVPLAELNAYARSLSSMTGGQGSYTMEFSHYDMVPGNVQKEIIDKAQLKEEEDE